MFGRFSRKYWKRNKTRNRRSPFGGTVKSMDEIAALSQRISKHESIESHAAEEMLNFEWEKVEKKHKT